MAATNYIIVVTMMHTKATPKFTIGEGWKQPKKALSLEKCSKLLVVTSGYKF